MSEIALFPGTFDPFTKGHLSIISRAASLFESIYVAVGENSNKTPTFTIEQRITQIREATAGMPNVKVISYNGLTVDACKNVGAKFILRGVRSIIDFEYERNLADINRRIAGIETILLYSLPEDAAISSSVVRELNHYGYDTTSLLP